MVHCMSEATTVLAKHIVAGELWHLTQALAGHWWPRSTGTARRRAGPCSELSYLQ